MHKRSVFIVGAGGMVGATAAQALALKEIVGDIVLIDVAQELVHGQAMDLNHATAFTDGVRVRVGSYDQIAQDDIVVIASGAPQKPGQSRLELLEVNAAITRDVVGKVMQQGKPVFIIMVANPVDILTHIALQVSGLPPERVFGTGTTLDSARLRVLLAQKLHVSQREVQAYILGEHGDSSFPALTSATVGGVPLAAFPGYSPALVEGIDGTIRQAAYQIIEAKKSTYYGIGHVIAQVVRALVRGTGSVFPVCSLTRGEYGLQGVVLGLPSLITSDGAHIVDGYVLSDLEHQQLKHSAQVLRDTMAQLA